MFPTEFPLHKKKKTLCFETIGPWWAKSPLTWNLTWRCLDKTQHSSHWTNVASSAQLLTVKVWRLYYPNGIVVTTSLCYSVWSKNDQEDNASSSTSSEPPLWHSAPYYIYQHRLKSWFGVRIKCRRQNLFWLEGFAALSAKSSGSSTGRPTSNSGNLRRRTSQD